MANWHGLLVGFSLDNSLLLLGLISATVVMLVYAWWCSDQRVEHGAINHTSTKGDDVGVGTLELQMAATTLAVALTSLYLYTHDLTILLFSGAVMLGWAMQSRSNVWLRVILAADLLAPLVFFYSGFSSGFVVVMVLTFAVLIWLLTQHHPLYTQLAVESR